MLKDNFHKALFYMLISSVFFSLMGLFGKRLGDELSSLEITFFRNIIGVILIGFTIFTKPINNHGGGRPILLVLRGVIGFLALLIFFYNLNNMTLANAMTYSKIFPIFTAFFSYIFLKEYLGFKGWVSIFIGFIGIILIAKPEGLLISKSHFMGILCGALTGLAYTSIRELKKYYDLRLIMLSFMIAGTVCPLILMYLSNFYTLSYLDFLLTPFVVPKPSLYLDILLLGLSSSIAQIYMTKSFSMAKSGYVGTVSYSSIIFSIFIGLYIGEALPDLFTMLGILLIVLAGVLIVFKNKNA